MLTRLTLPMRVAVVPHIALPTLAGLLLAMTTLTLSLLKVAVLMCHSLVVLAKFLLPLGLALANRRAAYASQHALLPSLLPGMCLRQAWCLCYWRSRLDPKQ